MSIGLIKLNGEELYLELEYDGPLSDWVKEHVVPMLAGNKVSREEARKQIKEFVGNNHPYAVSYVNQYDTIYLYKLFQGDEHPFFWLPIDFASILFGANIDPNSSLFEDVDGKYREHHALDDAQTPSRHCLRPRPRQVSAGPRRDDEGVVHLPRGGATQALRKPGRSLRVAAIMPGRFVAPQSRGNNHCLLVAPRTPALSRATRAGGNVEMGSSCFVKII